MVTASGAKLDDVVANQSAMSGSRSICIARPNGGVGPSSPESNEFVPDRLLHTPAEELTSSFFPSQFDSESAGRIK